MTKTPTIRGRRERINSPSKLAKEMARVFGECSYTGASEMDCALIALELLNKRIKL